MYLHFVNNVIRIPVLIVYNYENYFLIKWMSNKAISFTYTRFENSRYKCHNQAQNSI